MLGSLKEKGLDLEKQIEEVKEMKAEKQNEKTNMEREKEIFDNFNNNLDARKKDWSLLKMIKEHFKIIWMK